MKKYFLTGLMTLLPLAVTIAIAIFIIDFLTQPFLGVVQNFLSHYPYLQKGFLFLNSEQVLRIGSQFLILIVLFFFTIFLGFITRWFLFKSLLKCGDFILHRIPIINKLYKTMQEVIQTIFTAQNNTFKKVVIVEFPYKDVFCIGLLSRESPDICNKATNNNLVSVFVPTTPNPTSGYLVLYAKEDMQEIDMTVEEAVKFIVSCGVISPNHDKHNEEKSTFHNPEPDVST